MMLLKSAGVISGLNIVGRVCQRVDPEIEWRPLVEDGCTFATRTVIGEISGPARSVLTAERTALNFIQRLSGVATLTRAFVDAIAGTQCPDRRHPQDDAGHARAREAGGAAWRRLAITASACSMAC